MFDNDGQQVKGEGTRGADHAGGEKITGDGKFVRIQETNPCDEPTTEAVELALEAFHRGSPEEFDRLLERMDGEGPPICALFAELMGMQCKRPVNPVYCRRA